MPALFLRSCPTVFQRFRALSLYCCLPWLAPLSLFAQSADWQEVIWREPQVRYLLADMTLSGGRTDLYRKYAAEERDPDSREAIRLWDTGARVINTNEFERKWVANRFGKDGRVMRIVFRGSDRTITGREVLLSTDGSTDEARMRIHLLEMTLGAQPSEANGSASLAEARRRWQAGERVTNTNWFRMGEGKAVLVHNTTPVGPDLARLVRLISDDPFPETNVRYFMADIALGGSIEFYRAAAERDHEMGCLEAVRRTEEGFKIVNIDLFERKKVDGRTLITRKGSSERISGMLVKLSSDPMP